MSFVDDLELDEKISQWLEWDLNESTRKQILELVEKRDIQQLKSRMIGRLAFGTAGIRAPMEAGFTRMNDLVVIQVTQGLIAELKEEFPNISIQVAIGFDGRYNSNRYARLAANAFLLSNIRVHLFEKVVPTPLVSYATVKLRCQAGLMITASHNPKNDNGYKVYWSNGAQILSPRDLRICQFALMHSAPLQGVWNLSEIDENPLFNYAEKVVDHYFADAEKFNYFRELNENSPLKFAYSAFHGVGSLFTPRALTLFGFPSSNVVSVAIQSQPDPEFPTLPNPNPEEGEKVLRLSILTANQNGCSVILANDPDADRFQISEKRNNGEWRIFDGNEMGAILAWWIWHGWRSANPDKNASDVYFLNSVVSSSIVETMAEKEGFKVCQTLTGFKWMGNLADKLRSSGKSVLLAWEESIGFMPGDTLDKDGVLTAAMFAECCAYLHDKWSNLEEKLHDIYRQYGYHLTRNSYFVNYDPKVTSKIFADIRDFKGTGKYPKKIGSYDLNFVRDLTVGFDDSQPNNKPVLPVNSSAEMITFILQNQSVITLRASGTEPKIKYYIELKTKPGRNIGDLPEIQQFLECMENQVVQVLLQPKLYGFN